MHTLTTPPAVSPVQRNPQELRAARFAMRLSLIVGVIMLLGKSVAYYMTGSAAILYGFC